MALRATALLLGTLFGAGLAVSGMTDPGKVQGFLDPLGRFDPSLALVMGSALAVSALGLAVSRRLARPLVAERFDPPTACAIDARLVFGSAVFGVGWGLAGLCPGPALAGLVLLRPESAIFVAAMAGGMLLHRHAVAGPRRHATAADPPAA